MGICKDLSHVYLSTWDVASLLGLHRETVVKYCREKKIPAKKVGGNWYIKRKAFEEFMEVSRFEEEEY